MRKGSVQDFFRGGGGLLLRKLNYFVDFLLQIFDDIGQEYLYYKKIDFFFSWKVLQYLF